jgi:hypothetical protein
MGNNVKKKDQPASGRGARPRKSFNPALVGVVLAAVIGVGALAFWKSSPTVDPAPAAASTGSPDQAARAPQSPQPSPQIVERAAAMARLGPHKQANLPPIPFAGFPPPRPPAVVTAAYKFAAEHPEILSYVPCFCGCERAGHQGNADCFVHQRAANGDVISWDEHGLECAVCIDVANRSRQMFESGASVRDIRAAIDREFGAARPSSMPTPQPPPAGAHGNH